MNLPLQTHLLLVVLFFDLVIQRKTEGLGRLQLQLVSIVEIIYSHWHSGRDWAILLLLLRNSDKLVFLMSFSFVIAFRRVPVVLMTVNRCRRLESLRWSRSCSGLYQWFTKLGLNLNLAFWTFYMRSNSLAFRLLCTGWLASYKVMLSWLASHLELALRRVMLGWLAMHLELVSHRTTQS